jgi:hypothetical protein
MTTIMTRLRRSVLWTRRSCDGKVRPSALLLAYFGAAFDVLGA